MSFVYDVKYKYAREEFIELRDRYNNFKGSKIEIMEKGGLIPKILAFNETEDNFKVDGLSPIEKVYYPFPVPQTDFFSYSHLTPEMRRDQFLYICDFQNFLFAVCAISLDDLINLFDEKIYEEYKEYYRNYIRELYSKLFKNATLKDEHFRSRRMLGMINYLKNGKLIQYKFGLI